MSHSCDCNIVAIVWLVCARNVGLCTASELQDPRVQMGMTAYSVLCLNGSVLCAPHMVRRAWPGQLPKGKERVHWVSFLGDSSVWVFLLLLRPGLD